MYYRLVMESGHVGAGKSIETVRYFRAENPVDLFSFAARMPRAKGKMNGKGVKLIEKISKVEYERGVEFSSRNPYLKKRKAARKARRSKESVLFH